MSISKTAVALALFLLLVSAQTHADDRSFDGFGNNIANPFWGSSGTNFIRLDPSVHYDDLISAPAAPNRTNARDVSNLIGAQNGVMFDQRNLSDYVWQWGQFLDHDITLTPSSANPAEFFPIDVNHPGDPLRPMIPMSRSDHDPLTGTGIGNPREQYNENTAFIDASMVYGSGSARADALRTFDRGLLKTSAGGLMLPRNTDLLPNANGGNEPDATLFLAGDVRANEQVGLTAMHTLFVREHNRLANEIAAANPGWNDHQIYQRARKTVGALVQSITYQEYLPALLGAAAPAIANAAYDANVNATMANEFAASAFRLGHTQVSSTLMRMDHDGQPAPGGPVELMDAFFVPSFFTSPDEVDYLLHGLARQVQQATDVKMIDTLRNAMFGPPGSGGLDLLSLNIQRGRDHGLGSYTEFQKALGMTAATSFEDITSDVDLQNELASAYGTVDNIDAWIGLLAEDQLADAAVGPTMAVVIAGQFQRLMEGDRFFMRWDEDLFDSEIGEIMNTTLSDIILRNTDISSLPSNVFFVPEPHTALWMLGGWAVLARRRRPTSPRSAKIQG